MNDQDSTGFIQANHPRSNRHLCWELKLSDKYQKWKFFNLFLYDGDLNPDRGLYQFRNGSLHKPRPDDIIVFSADRFGHVAIVSEVGPDYIEIAQQNVRDESRDRFELMNDNGRWRIRDARILGWLSRFKTTLKSH